MNSVDDNESKQSSEVDELLELTMRTGLVKKKVPSIRVPSLKKKDSKDVNQSAKRKKLKFAPSTYKSGRGTVTNFSQSQVSTNR